VLRLVVERDAGKFEHLLPACAIGPVIDLRTLALREGVIGINAQAGKRAGEEIEAALGLRLDAPDRRHLVAVRRRRPGDEIILGVCGIEIGRALKIGMVGKRHRRELRRPVRRVGLQKILDPLVETRQFEQPDILVIIFGAQVEIMRRCRFEVGVAGVDRQDRFQAVGPRDRNVDEADPRLRRQLADLRPRDRQEIAAAKDQIVALAIVEQHARQPVGRGRLLTRELREIILEFEVDAEAAAVRRIDRPDIGREDQIVRFQPRPVETHAADHLQLAEIEPRLDIACQILFERAFSVDIVGQRDRGEQQPARAADIVVHIVDKIPQRFFADHDEARSIDSDAREIVGNEIERERTDRDIAAELRTREPALEFHALELDAGFDIGQRSPSGIELGAIFARVPVVPAARHIDLAARCVDGEIRRVVDEPPSGLGQQRKLQPLAAARAKGRHDIAKRRIGRGGQEIFGARVGGGHAQLQPEVRRMPLAAMRIADQIFEIEAPCLGAAAKAVGVGDVAGAPVIHIVLRVLERFVSGRQIDDQRGAIATRRRRDIVEIDAEAFVQLCCGAARFAMLIVEFQIAVVANLPLGRERRSEVLRFDMVEARAEAERKGARCVGQEGKGRQRINGVILLERRIAVGIGRQKLPIAQVMAIADRTIARLAILNRRAEPEILFGAELAGDRARHQHIVAELLPRLAAFDKQIGIAARAVERRQCLDFDQAAGARAVLARQEALADRDLADRIGEQIRQVGRAADAIADGQVEPVELHRIHVGIESADRDIGAVAGQPVALERHARDAAQGFRNRRAGEVAEIVDRHDVRAVLGRALEVERVGARAARTIDDDLACGIAAFVRSPRITSMRVDCSMKPRKETVSV